MSATRNDTQTTTSDDSPTDSPEEVSAPDEQQDDGTVAELPLDQTFELLKNKRRRAVLEYLRETEDDVVSIGELAEYIAAVENDIDIESVSSSQRKRAYVGLYQCHLPKMDDMDVIDFRKNRGEISRAQNAAQLERFLDRDHDASRPWYLYYASIALGGIGLLFIGQLAASAGGLVSIVVPLLVTISLLICAVLHAYDEDGLKGSSVSERLSRSLPAFSSE